MGELILYSRKANDSFFASSQVSLSNHNGLKTRNAASILFCLSLSGSAKFKFIRKFAKTPVKDFSLPRAFCTAGLFIRVQVQVQVHVPYATFAWI